MVKAVFIDIDGTLINDNKEVTLKTKDIIDIYNRKNVYTIINSGRARKFTLEYSKKANTSNYIISSNGADIYDINQNKTIYKDTISKENLLKIYKYIIDHKLGVTINYESNSVTNEITIYNTYAVLKTDEELFDIISSNNNIVQLLVTNKDIDILKDFKKFILSFDNLNIENQSKKLKDNLEKETDLYYLDVIKKNNNKGTGLDRICHYLDIDIKDTIAIGDSFNDISMLEKAGIGIAMKNGQDKLKKVANFVTEETNNNNGLALCLESLLNTCEKNKDLIKI